ncbi:hypothetical protein HX052_16905 [Myroides marinus]|uniref:hypothetical protein n=1 Tax=Myroides marinus TaxID=703342 RepID=UPI002576E7BA|nr:hypothetical protein [Myroides marinus]MDM1373700.1 hypothetical protein [Myroides marinus]MDM1391618.1 hypothetical protein [Myroides marinus]
MGAKLQLIIVAIGCSKEDDNTETRELIVKVDKMAIDEGETLKFSAVDSNNKDVQDVDFYVNSTKVDSQYKFDKKGAYNVIAMKKGYITSAPKTILVGSTIVDKLELIADKTEIKANESVKFKVMSGGKEVSDYYIMITGQGPLLGNVWTSNNAGTFKLYAIKGGYLNSAEVTIVVKPKDIDDNQSFIYDNVKYGVDEAILAPHVEAGNDVKPTPYIYTDKNTDKKYQVYELVVLNNSQQILISYMMGVYVTDAEKDFVYPSVAKPEDVFPIGGLVAKGQGVAAKFTPQDFEKLQIVWKTKYDPKVSDKGEIKYDMLSKDKKVMVKFEGIYSASKYVTIEPKGTNTVANTDYRNRVRNMWNK